MTVGVQSYVTTLMRTIQLPKFHLIKTNVPPAIAIKGVL
jgi:hypothetical protein